MEYDIILTVTCADTEWADEYGISTDEAPKEFAESMERQVPEVSGALEKVWPMVRGMLTAASLTDFATRDRVLAALVDAGLTFGDCVNAFAARQVNSDKWTNAASKKYGEGIEIDGNAIVSAGDDDGAYVMAWVWVGDEDV